MSADDPRVDILAQALAAAWAKPTPSTRPTKDEARTLLARLDSASPRVAVDPLVDPVYERGREGLAGWLDEQIAEARVALRDAERGADLIDLVDDGSAVGADEYVRLQTLREVRDRLGVTTHTKPEEGTDD